MQPTKIKGPVFYVLIGVVVLLLGGMILMVLTLTASIQPGTPTQEPTRPGLVTPGPTEAGGEQLEEVDDILGQSSNANIAYNAPDRMKLGETVTINLRLNPSKSTDELGQEITDSGTIVTGTIEVTPLMKAELMATNGGAFSIQSIHDSAEQVVSKKENTEWAWMVTAQEGGTQTLTLVIYRMIKYQGEEYWREVETYKEDITVEVSFGQKMKAIDWKWIVGILLTAVLIPFFWRWYDKRNKASPAKP